MLSIKVFKTPYLSSNMYLISDNGHGLIIDPYFDRSVCEEIDKEVGRVNYIILTHEHFDHISGTDEIRDRYGSKVICSKICAERITNPKSNMSRHFAVFASLQDREELNEECLAVKDYVTFADETFETEIELNWESHKLVLHETPGHSLGSICILLDNEYLFTGDSLLNDDEIITRFPGGNENLWNENTFPYFESLSGTITVYPGHYGSFNLLEKMDKIRARKSEEI